MSAFKTFAIAFSCFFLAFSAEAGGKKRLIIHRKTLNGRDHGHKVLHTISGSSFRYDVVELPENADTRAAIALLGDKGIYAEIDQEVRIVHMPQPAAVDDALKKNSTNKTARRLGAADPAAVYPDWKEYNGTVMRAWVAVNAAQAHGLYLTTPNAATATAGKVCFIDSGIWGGHPDLGDNIDQTVGYNAITRTNGFAAQTDDYYHGTHTAGIYAAISHNSLKTTVNGVASGTAGLGMPNNVGVKPISCKFMNSVGVGFVSNAILCMKWCQSQGATITSHSWGNAAFSQALHDEMAAHSSNMLHVVASGNAGVNMDGSAPGNNFPAADMGLTNMLVVGAAAITGLAPYYVRPATFSNYGLKSTHVFAPGDYICSPQWQPGSSALPNGYVWRTQTGTSAAAPHVTATAALVMNVNPLLTPAQVISLIVGSANKTPAFATTSVAGGLLDMLAAVRAAITGVAQS